MANGDIKGLEIKIVPKAPFVKLAKNKLAKECLEMFDDFENYIESLQKVVEVECVKLMDRAKELPESAAKLVENASSEFEALSGLEKVSAIANAAANVRALKAACLNVDKYCKKIMADLKDLEAAVNGIEKSLTTLEADGKKCMEHKCKNAYECYTTVHGPITEKKN